MIIGRSLPVIFLSNWTLLLPEYIAGVYCSTVPCISALISYIIAWRMKFSSMPPYLEASVSGSRITSETAMQYNYILCYCRRSKHVEVTSSSWHLELQFADTSCSGLISIVPCLAWKHSNNSFVVQASSSGSSGSSGRLTIIGSVINRKTFIFSCHSG